MPWKRRCEFEQADLLQCAQLARGASFDLCVDKGTLDAFEFAGEGVARSFLRAVEHALRHVRTKR